MVLHILMQPGVFNSNGNLGGDVIQETEVFCRELVGVTAGNVKHAQDLILGPQGDTGKGAQTFGFYQTRVNRPRLL